MFGGTEAGSALARVTEAAAPLGIGLAAFVSLIPLLRIEEGLQFWESIRRRWGGRMA
jgi:hypothetical protein